jgi:hypothetical protein
MRATGRLIASADFRMSGMTAGSRPSRTSWQKVESCADW